MKIEVGEVIYVIDSKKRTILPARVNEQVITKKIEGETISHNIQMPNGRVISLELLDALFFHTIEEVRDHLLARAREVIDASINNAKDLAHKQFDTDSDVGDVTTKADAQNTNLSDSSESMEMTLPDGSVAKVNVNVPPEFFE